MRKPDPTAGLPDEGPLSPAEVLAILGVHRNKLDRWATAGVLASFRTLGGHRRYRPADVEALRVKLQQPQQPRLPPELVEVDLLDVAEVARMLGVHPKRVVIWSDTGKLPAVWPTSGGQRRWRRTDVEALRARLQGLRPWLSPN